MSTFQQRAGGYLRDAGGVNLEKIGVYIALGVGLFLVWKIYSAAKGAKDALNDAGGAIGRGLYDLFHPSAGERLTSPVYAVWYPPQSKFFSVDSADVSDDGTFTKSGVKYRIVIPRGTPQKAPNGITISKVAIPV